VRKLFNPFPITGYHGPAYFCDREAEFNRLRDAVRNGRNLTLVARRRLGKTSLLHHFEALASKDKPSWKVIYVDLIKTHSLRGLYELITRTLFTEKRKSSIIPNLNLLARFRMTIGIDPITQLPQASFDLRDDQVPQSLHHLFDWIKDQDHMVIIFDEFQQILSYPEKDVEPLLRSEMERLPDVRFIFSGSDQQLLQEMFSHARRPFYQSTEGMTLQAIDPDSYRNFIDGWFRKSKREISTEAIDYVLAVTEGETLAVQRLCNALFESGLPHVTAPLAQETLVRVLDQQQVNYERLRAIIDPHSNAFKALRAIARLGTVEELTGKEMIKESGIFNASSISKAVKSLYRYGVISQVIAPSGKLGYRVDDALFRIWLKDLPD